ncbi:hypothetical protein [Ornithinimicrobium sp. LYQ103]|uniref:hypothetical protein n=1 Tax=Ornithinimicrobium sp. LYQ103 TaxID=3378796 RepID=UPI003854962A
MSRPHTPLLGRLAGWFNEVIVTDALRVLLDHQQSMHSFLDYVGRAAGTDLSMVRTFERERVIDDGRVDLEGLDADGRPRLLIEAKLSHLITTEQMSRYLAFQRLALAGAPGVLMLLVPASRVAEAGAVMDRVVTTPAQAEIRSVVLSWDECLEAIAGQLPASESSPVSAAADVAQLQAVCREFSSWVVPPSMVPDADRQEHLRVLRDKLHHRLRDELPSAGPLVARDPAHTHRYFGVDDADNYVSIGLAPGLEAEGGTPFWLWVPEGTPEYGHWRAALRRSILREQLEERGGGLWLPLHMGTDIGGPELVEHLAAQSVAILALLHPTSPSRVEPGPQ